MNKQTKLYLGIGVLALVGYWLWKNSKKVTTSSSAEEKKEMAETQSFDGICPICGSMGCKHRFGNPNISGVPVKLQMAGVDMKTNSFFKVVSTRDPRDIKV